VTRVASRFPRLARTASLSSQALHQCDEARCTILQHDAARQALLPENLRHQLQHCGLTACTFSISILEQQLIAK
jgi:hypothetical protein